MGNNRNELSNDRKLKRKSWVSMCKVKNFDKKWQVDSRITTKGKQYGKNEGKNQRF